MEVTGLADPAFRRAVDALAVLDMEIRVGGQHSTELRQPWLLQAMATRLSVIGVKESAFFRPRLD